MFIINARKKIKLLLFVDEKLDIISFTDNEVDGDTFMDFNESDLKEMMPNKMGVVKKILKLQQEVGCNKLNKNILI